jgi:hypothetical protein
VAEATADFYVENTPIDGVPYWDTGAPGLAKMGAYLERAAEPFNDHEPVDSSAAAIAAQGLLRLGNYLTLEGDGARGRRYRQAAFTVARTLFAEPYLSTDPAHEGLLLHTVYHRPNGWDHVPEGRKVPCGESAFWGDHHALELALLCCARPPAYPLLPGRLTLPAEDLTMARSAAAPRRRRVLLLGLLALGPVASALRGAEEAAWTARDLASKVEVVAEPGFAFRYNSGRGPYGRSTESLLERRRAYFPGETVKLTRRRRWRGRWRRVSCGLYDLDRSSTSRGGPGVKRVRELG